MMDQILEPNSIAGAIVTGILSGAFTSGIIFVLKILFSNYFIPWYRDFKYKGLDVSGEWELKKEYEDSIEYCVIDLKQKADEIKGTLTVSISSKSNGSNEIKTFSVSGSIEDRFVILEVRNTNKKQIGLGSILVEAVGNGYELLGCEMWYSMSNRMIKSDEISLVRK